jgi:hypothetical protein
VVAVFSLLNCARIFLKPKDCRLVALHIILQKLNISLSHLPTVTDSSALLQKRGQVITPRLSMKCWWRPQSVVLNVARFSWACCYSLPCCTNIFRTNSCATLMSLRTFITRTSCCCKTLNDFLSPQQLKNHQKNKRFDYELLVVRRTRRHRVTHFSVANGKKTNFSIVWNDL